MHQNRKSKWRGVTTQRLDQAWRKLWRQLRRRIGGEKSDGIIQTAWRLTCVGRIDWGCIGLESRSSDGEKQPKRVSEELCTINSVVFRIWEVWMRTEDSGERRFRLSGAGKRRTRHNNI